LTSLIALIAAFVSRRRQQDALGRGRLVHRQLEEVDALHAGMRWSASRSATPWPRSASWSRTSSAAWPGVGADDLELLAVAAAQVALDGAADAGVVVHGEQDGAARLGGAGGREASMLSRVPAGRRPRRCSTSSSPRRARSS
jgi:hypothetical protein